MTLQLLHLYIHAHLKDSLELIVVTHEEVPFKELLIGAERVPTHVSEDMIWMQADTSQNIIISKLPVLKAGNRLSFDSQTE